MLSVVERFNMSRNYFVVKPYSVGNMCWSIRNKKYSSIFRKVSELRNNIEAGTIFPVNETINIISSRVFNTCDQCQGFTREQACKILNFCAQDHIYVFEDFFYEQINGASMRGCISPHQFTCICLIMKRYGYTIVQGKGIQAYFVLQVCG